MNKKDIIDFFDRCAPDWDKETVRNESVISKILNCAAIREGIDVLDVACGTGILFPSYRARDIASLTAIDISPQMAHRAKENDPKATVICGDAAEVSIAGKFDAIVIYNAFPHFIDPSALVENLSRMLKTQGRLTIAHGIGREALNRLHHLRAQHVSTDLMHEDDLERLLSQWLTVDVKISDHEKYIVSGTYRSIN